MKWNTFWYQAVDKLLGLGNINSLNFISKLIYSCENQLNFVGIEIALHRCSSTQLY